MQRLFKMKTINRKSEINHEEENLLESPTKIFLYRYTNVHLPLHMSKYVHKFVFYVGYKQCHVNSADCAI